MYRVVVDANHEGCEHCNHGAYWTIVWTEDGEETGIGQSFGDKEITEDICDLMNTAYEHGQEDMVSNAEEEKLVAFFRSPEGDKLGRDGDYDNLSPAETAIRAMRHLTALDVSK